jgi:hypothetical protein
LVRESIPARLVVLELIAEGVAAMADTDLRVDPIRPAAASAAGTVALRAG